MQWYIICQIVKADLLERTRRFSFVVLCTAVMFLTFFSVPNPKAPFVSICIEPDVFLQGSNPSWIPIAIALCGGILFPIIGFGFVRNNVDSDRKEGILCCLQSMGMNKWSYVMGKFLSNLLILSIVWLLSMFSAFIMMKLSFPYQSLGAYDFLSPFLGMYPSIAFASVFALFTEITLLKRGFGNWVGMIFLFAAFLINYSFIGSNSLLLRLLDFNNYRWLMESINHAVESVMAGPVKEMGILVPADMLEIGRGNSELWFRGLLESQQYFKEKMVFIPICIFFVLLGSLFLESGEDERKILLRERKQREKRSLKFRFTNRFVSEFLIMVRDFPRVLFVLTAVFWIYGFAAPLKYTQGYFWVLTLIFTVSFFSQIGCLDYEHGLKEYFSVIGFFTIRQMIYSYLWGVLVLLFISAPVMVGCLRTQKYFHAFCYAVFCFFIPSLSCFLGEYSKSKKTFETIYLLICFLLINLPLFWLREGLIIMMAGGSLIFLIAALLKRIWDVQ